ncbi:MAG: YeeE/YedE family protein [Bdellovibrionales bacterium]|nr:YeeE/YedE family protein [Bdellovibrionales bacterium]
MYWSWMKGGTALAACFLITVAVMKPIGVSTQFVVADGILAKQFNSELVSKDETAKHGYASTNAYFNKSGGKIAHSVAQPLNYGFIFVLSMFLGGVIAKLSQKSLVTQVPEFHKARFGASTSKRYLTAFVGGAIVLFGARLAGGCTSGHMMSGMMQTALSGYLFAMAAFAAAIPAAIILYGKK